MDKLEALAREMFEAANGGKLVAWSDATREYWLDRAEAMPAAPPALCQRTLEAAAKVVQEMPDPILTFYDRGPGSPPGNSYQPLKRSDLVNAILALGKDDR